MIHRLIFIFNLFVVVASAADPQAGQQQRLNQAMDHAIQLQANRLARETGGQNMPPLLTQAATIFTAPALQNPFFSALKSLSTLIMWKFTTDQMIYYKELSRNLIELNRDLLRQLQQQHAARAAAAPLPPGPQQPAPQDNGITPPALSGFWGSCGRGLVSIGNACVNLGAGWVEHTRQINMDLKRRLVERLQAKLKVSQRDANQLATQAEQQIDPSIRYIHSLANDVLDETGTTAENFMDHMRAADARRTEQSMTSSSSDDSQHKEPAPLFPPVTPLDVPEKAEPTPPKSSEPVDRFSEHAYTAGDQFGQGVPGFRDY